MSEQVNFVIEQYDNKTLAEANEQFALMIAQLKAENAKLRNLVGLAALVLDALEHTTSWRFTGDGMTFDSAYFNAKLRDLETEVDE